MKKNVNELLEIQGTQLWSQPSWGLHDPNNCAKMSRKLFCLKTESFSGKESHKNERSEIFIIINDNSYAAGIRTYQLFGR